MSVGLDGPAADGDVVIAGLVTVGAPLDIGQYPPARGRS